MAMNLNEVATLTLRGETNDFDKQLHDLDTKAKELRKTLKDIEKDGGKGGENWKQYKNELKDVQDQTDKLKKEVDLTTLTYGQLQNQVKSLNRELKSLKPGTEDFIAATKRLTEAKDRLADVDKEVKGISKESDALGEPSKWQKITGGVGLVSKAFQAFFALQIIGYIIDIGKAIFEITGKFERYEKVLTNALGSEKLAKESMAAIKQMAKDTVFTVDELTEGYVKLVNRGMRPSQKEMIAMTDLAASQGKKFDELVEAALDAQTGEFERLKEFGIRASKSGDQVTLSFKGMNQVVKNTPEAIQGALVAFGQMTGVAGQNAKMMQTLEGQSSNLQDNFDALKVELGERLRPVFVAVLQIMSGGITVIRGLVNVIATVISAITSYWSALYDFAIGSGGVMKNLGMAIKEFLSGNFDAASKYWDQTKQAGAKVIDQIKTNAKTAASNIVSIWTDKAASQKAEFAGKEQGKKYQGGLTDEQKKAIKEREQEAEKARKKAEADTKKHLEEVQKANAKALEDLAKLESEAHIASIKDEMQREFVKLGAKRDAQAEEIMRSLADEKLKDQQIAALDKKLQEDITRVAGEFAEKKRKKAEEEEKKRLDTEKAIVEQERQAENALLDWKELMAKGNATKLSQIHQERVDKNYKATLDKLDAEEAAEKAKSNREITDKDQLDRSITAIEGKYHNERQLAEAKHASEVEKINKELQEKKKAAWTNASSAFGALLKGDLSAFVDYADKIVQGEKSAWQKRLAENQEKYEAVGAMAKAAAQFLADLEQRKAEKAIAAAQKERDEKVRLLNDQIAAEKAAEDAAESEKQRVTQESNDKIQSIKSQTEQTISSLEQQYRQLSSSEEKKKLADQLQGYKENADGKSQAAKEAADDAIAAAKEESQQSIKAAQEAEKAAIKAATNEKDQKIDAAEATRDAEIAAINKRKDVDQETRKQLLKEAQDKFDKEKQLAEDEAKVKIDQAKDTAKTTIDLAKDTAKTKTELAQDQRDAELKAIEAIQNGDEKAAKEILARAKQDAKDKIALAKDEATKKIDEAEREKREKLKKVEQEKQTRIQNQKELNRAIEQENARAKQKEVEAKRQAWKAQQKADIASALITGALATIKALASGFWPVNLVFAALSAVMTGIQVAKIKSQPEPTFAHGGFIPNGPRHASVYGRGGIGLVDNETGRNVGEMEGGEAIISREQTRANLPLIQRMFANARTPGRRGKPVTDDRDALGHPAGFRDGGLFESGYWKKDMFLFGGIKRKPGTRFDDGGYVEDSGGGGGDSSSGGDGVSNANAEYEESKKQFQEQIKKLVEIREAVEKSGSDTQQRLSTADTNIRNAISQAQQAQTWAQWYQTMQLANALELLRTDTKTGLADVKTTTKTALDALNRNLTLAMLQQQNKQSMDTDRLVMALALGFTHLDEDLKASIQNAGNKTVSAINSAKLTNQLVISNLTMRMVDGFDALLNQSEADFDRLADRLEQSTERAADRTVAVVNKASLTNQLALSSLALKTTTSLDKLSNDTKRSLSSLERATVQSLDDSALRTEKALGRLSDDMLTELTQLDEDVVTALALLSDDVIQSLGILNRDTKNSLTILGNKTDAALAASALSTKRSVDSLSVEVRSLKGSINGVEWAVREGTNATRGVEGAIWATNQGGRLDALIGAMSTFGGK